MPGPAGDAQRINKYLREEAAQRGRGTVRTRAEHRQLAHYTAKLRDYGYKYVSYAVSMMLDPLTYVLARADERVRPSVKHAHLGLDDDHVYRQRLVGRRPVANGVTRFCVMISLVLSSSCSFLMYCRVPLSIDNAICFPLI